MSQRLIPIADEAQMKAAGIPWTTHAARWQHRIRERTNLADAFVRISSRVYVDPDKFHELARENGAGR